MALSGVTKDRLQERFRCGLDASQRRKMQQGLDHSEPAVLDAVVRAPGRLVLPRIPLVHRPEPSKRVGLSDPFFYAGPPRDSRLRRNEKTPVRTPGLMSDRMGDPARTRRSGAGVYQADFASRRRALCWKNRAWLITAETLAGWNGFAMRNAGSGRSPVRKRSG